MRFSKNKTMNNKGSLQLSMNMIVVLIISVMILAMGIWFVNKIVRSSTDTAEASFESIDQNLANIMCSGSDIVCLQPSSAEIGITKMRKFTLKIMNLDVETNFKVETSFKGAYATNDENMPIAGADASFIENNWIFYNNRDFPLRPNEEKSRGIVISAKSEMANGIATTPGVYKFNVKVMYDPDGTGPAGTENQFGRTQNVFVTVK